MILEEGTQKVSVAQKLNWALVHRAWAAVVRRQASKGLVDFQYTEMTETSSQGIEASEAVVQRRLEPVHRILSAVAGWGLVIDKPQGYTAGDFRTPPEAHYKSVACKMRLGQVYTAHLVMEAKNKSG
jgi:hypothetical protein